MKEKENIHHSFDSLSAAHQAFGLPAPLHPLITLIDNTIYPVPANRPPHSHVLNFYKISYRTALGGKLKYGQDYYDFNEGGLMFASPNQVIGNALDPTVVTNARETTVIGNALDPTVVANAQEPTVVANAQAPPAGCAGGYTLLIHPDFLLSYPLAKKIRQYGFFSYSANEALHLSDKEKATVISIFKIIEDELNSRIDDFSQDVIISQIELLLNYANRFYKRQFITRKAASSDLLQKLELILDDYFAADRSLHSGIPTVQHLSENLHITPSYLSDMLRSLTGQNAQQHIHNKLLEKAKEKLSVTGLSVSEIAYELGFEHPQSFSKFFKTKTKQSPLEFRRSFN